MRTRSVRSLRVSLFLLVSFTMIGVGARPSEAFAADDTPLFIAGAGFELAGRRVGYTDLVIENLRTYEVFGVPVVRVEGEVYPGARRLGGVLRAVGLVARYAGAVGLSSSLPSGEAMDTSWHRFEVGVRGRAPLFRNRVVAGVEVTYAYWGFDFAGSDARALEAPSATYHALRLGADGRLKLGPVAAMAGFGYRVVPGSSGLIDRFRDGQVGGIDVSLGVAVPLPAGIELRAGAQYTRFYYSFFPDPGDAYIAGGALDEAIGFQIGAAYVHGP